MREFELGIFRLDDGLETEVVIYDCCFHRQV